MKAEFKLDDQKWQAFLGRIKKQLTSIEVDKTIKATAYWGLREVVKAMAKRTGALKRSWKVNEPAIPGGEYAIESDSKVAKYLEDGTKAHGPKTAKFLYIPLRPGAAVWRKGFVYGKDYVLAKRVKGIDGLKYLEPLAKRVLAQMVKNFEQKVGAI
jgi:hypothetical protein